MIQFKWAPISLALLAGGLVISACGGGSSGGSGSFSNEPLRISVSSEGVNHLPLNVENFGPRIGGPFTATISVKAENDQGPLNSGEFVCLLEGASVDVAALYFMDNSRDEFRDETDPDTGETVEVREPRRSVTLPVTAGGATFHLHAGNQPGRARVNCTVEDPNFDETRQGSTSIEIGGGAGSGDPTEIFLLPRTGLIWPPGFNEPQTDSVDVFLFDENRGIVDDPEQGTNNLLVQILSGPGAGEYLVGRNADGDILRGSALLLSTSSGVADFQVVSGFDAGFIVLGVTADQFDNNVDNAITSPVFGASSIVVTTTGIGPPLTIETDSSLPSGERGRPYATLLEASGGRPPYSWSLAGGTSLPSGLDLSSTGVISGTPVELGESCFIAGVQDSTSPAPESAGPQSFCIDVQGDPPPAATLSVSTSTLPEAEAGVGYATILEASGGESPYQWTLDTDGGADGLELSGSGVLSWSDPEAGSYSIGVTVSSGDGQQAAAALSLQVVPWSLRYWRMRPTGSAIVNRIG
ncbi:MULTISPECIES: Ig domain-containing protein [unclassified Thioalkalivibrio]|uniref:Ig domain-containing protein n=1 Tax=unclassified Thioalkalivibrio TaxID=2621013 RepID=UPI0003734129|nr:MULTISPECIES: Ig domain-containing protein [unclassified Thioalkalivibrio]